MNQFHKVYELEDVNNVLTPAETYYFCGEDCMHLLLANLDQLWTEIQAPPDDARGKHCNNCGKPL